MSCSVLTNSCASGPWPLRATRTIAAIATPAPIQVQALVASPWQDAITTGLGLTFSPTLTSDAVAAGLQPTPPSTPPPTAPSPAPPLASALAALGVLILAALAVAVVLGRRPRLQGSVVLSAEGTTQREFLLSGRSAAFESDTNSAFRGRIASFGKKGTPGIIVRAHTPDGALRATLRDGDSATVGRYSISYTAPRTRTLAMINAGLPDEPGGRPAS